MNSGQGAEPNTPGPQDEPSSSASFLATAQPDAFNRRLAFFTIAVSIASFAAIAPFSKTHLVRLGAFIPSYEATLVIIDLVTAVMLLSQFSIVRRRSLLAIACAYLMSSLLVAAHALSFPPGPNIPGLYGDAQTTVWLYVFWHATFPLLVGTYAVLANSASDRLPPNASARRAVAVALGAVFVATAALVALASAGNSLLTELIVDGDYGMLVSKGISPAILATCVVVVAIQWKRRNRSVLDVWLFAVLWVWMCDVSLSAVVSSARYDLGWYGGRIFGLAAASFVLIALLVEFDKLYSRLAHAMHEAEQRNAELIRSRDALVRSQRFEALGQLTGGIAHDFNNLLTAISGSLEMITRRAGDAERVAKHAANAAKAAERGGQLIRRLMSFARRQNLRPEVIDANAALREFGILAGNLPNAQVPLRFVFGDVGTICVDEAEFQVAFLNLVGNAREAMEAAGGEVVVSTRIVALSAHDLAETDAKPGDYVRISVADKGVGMKTDVQAHVFEPFFTTKKHGVGSGLGLSQVYGFARSAGGTVAIESRAGSGTTVILNLPVSTASHIERQQSPRPTGQPGLSGLSVLLVEDDNDVLVATKDRVEELGYAVLTATSGDEAFDLLSRGLPVDIVLSDIVMPGKLNGVQLAEAVRGMRPNLKLVLTSGYTGGALDQFRLPQGLLFLPKPYTQKDLAEMLAMAATA